MIFSNNKKNNYLKSALLNLLLIILMFIELLKTLHNGKNIYKFQFNRKSQNRMSNYYNNTLLSLKLIKNPKSLLLLNTKKTQKRLNNQKNNKY